MCSCSVTWQMLRRQLLRKMRQMLRDKCSETFAPATFAPTTIAPPTIAPATDAPKIRQVAPPTIAPPTIASSTIAPATNAPPILLRQHLLRCQLLRRQLLLRWNMLRTCRRYDICSAYNNCSAEICSENNTCSSTIFVPPTFTLPKIKPTIFYLFIYFTSLKWVARSAFAGFHRGPLNTDTYYRHN